MTAVQRCSRTAVEARHPQSAASRYGQTAAVNSAAWAGGVGTVALEAVIEPAKLSSSLKDNPVKRRRRPEWFLPETQRSRRRPIFPKGCPLSIFGAGELDFRVRDGNGYGLSARVTGIQCGWTWSAAAALGSRRPGGRRKYLRSDGSQGSDHDPRATDPWSVAGEVKPSTVSTAQLHPSPDFHMRPIEQVVSLRSYPVDPVGNLISRRASHLDAFSAYPNRT